MYYIIFKYIYIVFKVLETFIGFLLRPLVYVIRIASNSEHWVKVNEFQKKVEAIRGMMHCGIL